VNERDPRMEPHAGDTLGFPIKCIDCTRWQIRTVLCVEPRAAGAWIQYKTRSTIRLCQLSEWRRWARRAKVLPREVLRIRLLRAVHSDMPDLFPPVRIAAPGEYVAQLNRFGAVSVATANGPLGIKPAEFEWVFEPPQAYPAHPPDGGAQPKQKETPTDQIA
jgi:hypothetical protein